MILINSSYFVGELSLPNIQTTNTVSGVKHALQTVGENNLDVFVNKYVIDYLVRLFGRELAQKFVYEIAQTSPDQIWIDIKDQLLYEIGSLKMSPLANYVYFMLMSDATTKTTQAGEVEPKHDFAHNASVRHKLVAAWNDMVKMTADILVWYRENLDNYKDYRGKSFRRNSNSLTRYINEFGI